MVAANRPIFEELPVLPKISKISSALRIAAEVINNRGKLADLKKLVNLPFFIVSLGSTPGPGRIDVSAAAPARSGRRPPHIHPLDGLRGLPPAVVNKWTGALGKPQISAYLS